MNQAKVTLNAARVILVKGGYQLNPTIVTRVKVNCRRNSASVILVAADVWTISSITPQVTLKSRLN